MFAQSRNTTAKSKVVESSSKKVQSSSEGKQTITTATTKVEKTDSGDGKAIREGSSSIKRSKSLTRMLSGSLKRLTSAGKSGRKSKNEGALEVVQTSNGVVVETVDGGDCGGDKVVDNIVANLTASEENEGAMIRHTEHNFTGENVDVEVDELDILQLSGSSWNKSSKGLEGHIGGVRSASDLTSADLTQSQRALLEGSNSNMYVTEEAILVVDENSGGRESQKFNRSIHKNFSSEGNIWQGAKSIEQSDCSELHSADDLLVLDPDHPLMKRYQLAMQAHLLKLNEKLKFDLVQVEESIRKKEKERELAGSDLYAVSEELKKVSGNLDIRSTELTSVAAKRIEEEKRIEVIKQEHSVMLSKLTELRIKEKSLYDEIAKLNLQVFRLKTNKTDSDEIKIVRNALKKAQSDLSTVGEEKKKQDEIIGRLMASALRVEEEISFLESQQSVVKEQLDLKRESIVQINTEIQALSAQRKKLLQDWNQAVAGMRKRDETFTDIKNSIVAQQQDAIRIENEAASVVREVKQKKGLNEKIILNFTKLSTETKTVEKVIEQVKVDTTTIEEEISTNRHSAADLEGLFTKINHEKNQLQHAVSVASIKLRLETGELQKLEDEIMEWEMQHQTSGKMAQTAQTKLKKLRQNNKDATQVLSNIETEIGKEVILLAELDTKLKILTSSKEDFELQLKEKSDKIAAVQSETARLTVLIDKKTAILSKMKKKLSAQVKTNTGGEEVSPLKGELKLVNKSVSATETKIEQLKVELSKLQDEQIRMSTRSEEEDLEIETIKVKISVLEDKKIRLEDEMKENESDVITLKRHIQNLHNQIVRMNDMIGKSVVSISQEEKHKLTIEGALGQNLKASELEVIQLEEKLKLIKLEKERVMKSLSEAKLQLTVWEEKLTKAKEARDAVDNENGKAELLQMRSEIHRMQTRYGQLAKQQELMIKEMEKAVSKREILLVKGELGANRKSVVSTQALLSRDLVDLRNKVRQFEADLELSDMELIELKHQCETIQAAMEDKQSEVRDKIQTDEELETTIRDLSAKKHAHLHYVIVRKLRLKHLDEVKENKYVQLCDNEDTLKVEIEKEMEKRRKLEEIIAKVKVAHPGGCHHLKKVDHLLQMSDKILST